MKILSVNAGSSSLKFRLYEMPEEKMLMKGTIERIGLENGICSLKIGDQKIEKNMDIPNHTKAVEILIEQLIENKVISSLDEIKAVGHRIVHGGDKYSESVILNDEVVKAIEELNDLAPLHNPANLLGANAFKENIPSSINVACFDTAFHQTMDESTYLYPVPYEWYEKYGVRKYGFHGMSHKFITETMQDKLNKKDVNLIICHIGNGASLSAIKNGQSIDTSMGFTPNAGIMMGTRSGDIDYTMIDYIAKKENISYDEINNALNRKSGLEGIANMSDLRDLDNAFEAGEEKALLAFEMYTRRIAEYVAKYYIKLDGQVDAIVFTAGGGENDPIIRKETLHKLTSLGIKIDEEQNAKTMTRKGIEGIITSKESSIPCYVLATDEELMIARDTYKLVKEAE